MKDIYMKKNLKSLVKKPLSKSVKRRNFVLTASVAAAYASMRYTPAQAMGYVDDAKNYFNPEEQVPLILNPGTVMRLDYVDTSLGQIHYRHKKGSSNHAPIVCLHQTASSAAMFEKFAAAYNGPESIYAIDTPGFGGSFDPLNTPTMSEYGDTILEAIKGLGYEKVHLFGHHTGASIAIEIANNNPENVSSLMMIGPVVLTAEERTLFGQVYPKPFEPKADGSHLKIMWDYVESIGGNSSLDLHHREMVDTARAWQGHIKMYQKIWDQDFSVMYQNISVPMLIMCAEKDILWPMFDRAKEMRPDAVAKVIPGTNFEPDEAPLETAEAIKSYLVDL